MFILSQDSSTLINDFNSITIEKNEGSGLKPTLYCHMPNRSIALAHYDTEDECREELKRLFLTPTDIFKFK